MKRNLTTCIIRDLLLEYLVGAATVAVGWSGYFSSFLATISGGNIVLDPRISNAPFSWYEEGQMNVTSAGFYRTRNHIHFHD
jgi:hypothetical protein